MAHISAGLITKRCSLPCYSYGYVVSTGPRYFFSAALLSLPPYVHSLSLQDYTSPKDPIFETGSHVPCGPRLRCSQEILIYPILHGSSLPRIPRTFYNTGSSALGSALHYPGTDKDCADVIDRVRPGTLFLQLCPERLQTLGRRVWLSDEHLKRLQCSLSRDCGGFVGGGHRCFEYKDVWSRWRVYDRIHGGPLFVELQASLAAAMSLSVPGHSTKLPTPTECHIVPVDREAKTPIRRFHEKCLYSNGSYEFKGYMRYASQSINFWYNRKPLQTLSSLLDDFKRLCPLAYTCLVEERAAYMAAQILSHTDGGDPIAATNFTESPINVCPMGNGHTATGLNRNIAVVVCGAMEGPLLQTNLRNLLEEREEAIQLARKIRHSNTRTSEQSIGRTLAKYHAKHSEDVAGVSTNSRATVGPSLLTMSSREDYVRSLSVCPPATQVPLLIVRYILVPLVVVVFLVLFVAHVVRLVIDDDSTGSLNLSTIDPAPDAVTVDHSAGSLSTNNIDRGSPARKKVF
eukprot:GHVQ01013909.1.p1 GENE.GHVQ01013909.1~~GHVQ01013909.1.p1  ORF type:complete len:516 (+),score=41.26 GHVQ01013909.1:1524-3071(+)